MAFKQKHNSETNFVKLMAVDPALADEVQNVTMVQKQN